MIGERRLAARSAPCPSGDGGPFRKAVFQDAPWSGFMMDVGDSPLRETQNTIIPLFQLFRVRFKRRRRGPGQFLEPFGVFPSSLLLGRGRVRRGSGASLHYRHCAKGRESFPEPIFVLAQSKIRSRRIGSRSRRPSFLQFPRCKEATAGRPRMD